MRVLRHPDSSKLPDLRRSDLCDLFAARRRAPLPTLLERFCLMQAVLRLTLTYDFDNERQYAEKLIALLDNAAELATLEAYNVGRRRSTDGTPAAPPVEDEAT